VTVKTLPRAHTNWTYADLPTPEDGYRYEVIDGELLVTPSPTLTHQRVSGRIHVELVLQIQRTGAGSVFHAPTDVIFGDTRVVVPDLVVVLSSRRGILTERGIAGAPSLIVEILSPSTQVTDRERKRKLYASEGVAEYWLVDTEAHTIEVLALDETGYRLHGRFGPGQRVSSTLFPLDLEVDPVFAP
jgi:Uma2 family endonuclease